jgi:class 3 adenylate cyclase/tetratricopeptide (TPR) repeat protein
MPSEKVPPASAESEVRLVTILFADLVGSTAFTEGTDPETARLVLSRCLEHISRAVVEYGGTVARLMGDGLLAFFGAPEAHEDDPERAALAALQIHQTVTEYGKELGLPLQVRVGIQSGDVVMGQVGGEGFSEYTAMGQPINLAARLQAAAAPGTTLLGETTARLLQSRFDIEPTGELDLKGIQNPIEGFRLVGHSPGSEQGAPAAEPRPLNVLVGRETERRAMLSLLQGLRVGRGAICALIGESGIGKSRLLDEARFAANDPPLSWAEARAYSYRQDQPYGVIRDLIRQQFMIHPGDSPAMLDLKLERRLSDLFGDERGMIWPYLAVLLGAPIPIIYQDDMRALDGEALGRRISASFVRTIEAMAEKGPMLISFDDLQWADPSSLDLIESLFFSTERAALLIVLLFRPDRDRRVWDLKSQAERGFGHRYVEINLSPLDPASSRQLAANLLGVPSLPDPLWTVIRDRSEGNPFFIEELVRHIQESAAFVREGDTWRRSAGAEIRLPATLHEVIQARLDRLDRLERLTLQTAAVIGRRFAFRLLQELNPATTHLLECLLNLQRHDLIQEQARVPDREYVFKNAAIQEVAYRSLLADQRQDLHRAVGEALGRLYPDQNDEFAAMIAVHYERAAMLEQAQDAYQHAGDGAYRINANLEAAEHYGHALEIALGRGAGRETLIHLYLQRGRALELSSNYAQAMETYQGMRSVAQERRDPAMELAALLPNITLHVAPTPLFDASEGEAVAHQALDLARELADAQAEAKILWNFCILGRFTGRDEEAREYGEQSLAISRRLGMREQIGFTLTDLFWCYVASGNLAEAGAALGEALQVWQETDNLPLTVDNLSSTVFLRYLLGQYPRAIQTSDQAWELSQRIDNLWGKSFSRMYSGLVYIDMGQFGQAFEIMQLCHELSREAGFLVPQIAIPIWTGMAYGMLGQPGRGLATLESAYPIVRSQIPFLEPALNAVLAYLHALDGEAGKAARIIGLARSGIRQASTLNVLVPFASIEASIAEANQDYSRAISIIDEASSFFEKAESPPFLAEALYLQSRALAERGDLDRARRTAYRALSKLRGIEARRILWQILSLLSQIEAKVGNQARADELARHSITLVRYIAEHTGADDLRASFLNQPQVRSLLKA